LDPSVAQKVGSDWTNLTYKWTDAPDTDVVFSDDEIAAPTVTITKATGNPSTVTLILEVNNSGRTAPGVKSAMTIDVYDDACKAAIGKGLAADHPTDLDGNCITDLADFAELASEWLHGRVLPAAIRK